MKYARGAAVLSEASSLERPSQNKANTGADPAVLFANYFLSTLLQHPRWKPSSGSVGLRSLLPLLSWHVHSGGPAPGGFYLPPCGARCHWHSRSGSVPGLPGPFLPFGVNTSGSSVKATLQRDADNCGCDERGGFPSRALCTWTWTRPKAAFDSEKITLGLVWEHFRSCGPAPFVSEAGHPGRKVNRLLQRSSPCRLPGVQPGLFPTTRWRM